MSESEDCKRLVERAHLRRERPNQGELAREGQTGARARRRSRKTRESRRVPFMGMAEATRKTTSSRAVSCCHSASKPCRKRERSWVWRNQTAGKFAPGLQA